MTSAPNQPEIRTVLIALEDAAAGRETMEAAVNLAVVLGAELVGLYFENESLLRAAELPFVQEVTTGSGTVRPIDAQSMRRAMHHNAELARCGLERWAESVSIDCSFSVTRDPAVRRDLLAATRSDAVFFGCRSHAPGVRRPLGLRPQRVERPLLLVVCQPPEDERALQVGFALAVNAPRPIILLVIAHERETFRRIGSAASQSLCEQELAHTLLPHPVASPDALVRSAHDQRPGLVVLSRDCELASETLLETLVQQLDCPILLV